MFISYVCILIYDNSVLTQKHHSIPVRKAEDLASLRIAEERGTGVVTVYLEVWSQSPRKIEKKKKIYIYIYIIGSSGDFPWNLLWFNGI